MSEKSKIEAQVTNEVAKLYKTRIVELQDHIDWLTNKLAQETARRRVAETAFQELEQKIQLLEAWNQRLLEYMDMSEDDRKEFIKSQKEKSDKTKEYFERMFIAFRHQKDP